MGKKINILTLFLTLLISSNSVYSQTFNSQIGGRSAGMANSSVILHDLWSTYNNQAGLGYLENITVGVFHKSGFIAEQSLKAFSVAVPTSSGTISASYSYYGFSQYNESAVGLAYGKQFGDIISFGLKIDYLHTKIAGEYGNAGTVIFETGIIAEPIENLYIGAHLFNPARMKIGESEEKIPTILRLGLGYNFSNTVLLSLETEKDLEYDVIYKAGIEYQIIENVSLLAGVSTNPSQNAFGIGFNWKGLNADIAFMHHQTLGYKPHLSLNYAF
ncbi:MAG: hypothetical protein U9R54_08480 [Bacteroidota bacterium]|nr:hypothetical protein [Bacteroidota bacterium]